MGNNNSKHNNLQNIKIKSLIVKYGYPDEPEI